MKLVPRTESSVPDPYGEPFGKYVLLDRIGHGGMAEVFRAVSRGPEGFQRALVIKRILPHLSQDRIFVRMFIDEAKVCGLLSHPNLVQIYEFGKIENSFFIAMEHVHGRTLNAVQNELARLRRPVSLAAAAEIARQICVGLHHAHSLRSATGQPLGIVHRDISPSNVMLAFHGGVTILDFGIARMADELRHTHTQVGSVKGKASYMSPEQLRNEDVDRRSDIFSVGVVLHEMLTGRRLFPGARGSVDRKLVELSLPLPSERNPAVPPALDRVVMRALASERDARYATAVEMAADLDEVMHEARMSPREHARLLDDLFPDDASASDLRVVLPAAPSGRVEAPVEPAADPGQGYEAAVAIAGAAAGAGGGDGERDHKESGNGAGQREGSSQSGEEGREGRETPGGPRDASTDADSSPRRDQTSYLVDLKGLERRRGGRRLRLGVAGLSLLALGTVPVVLHATKHPGPGPKLVLAPPAQPAASVPRVAPAETDAHCFLDSSPQGATVSRTSGGQVVGRTPLMLVVPRSGAPISLRFERAGSKPVVEQIIPDQDKLVRVDLGAEIAQPVTRRKKRRAAARDFRDATLVNPFAM
jgi:eukaryotic-like serine/threonine-protein kinase